MEMKRYVVRAVEAGVLVAAVSTLLLAGCGGGGGSSGSSGNAGGSNPYVAALTDGVGLRALWLGSTQTVATVVTANQGSAGTYTFAMNSKLWSGSAWQANTPVTSSYFLNSAGAWIPDTTGATFTANADGSISYEGETDFEVAVDLSGAKIQSGKTYNLVDPAITGGSAVISVGTFAVPSATTTYPSGSTAWISIGFVHVRDQYQVGTSGIAVQTPTANLTALNIANANSYTLSSPLCESWHQLVYSAAQPNLATSTVRFDVYSRNGATCAAIASGAPVGTVDLTYKTVLGQPIAEFSNFVGTGLGSGWFSQTAGSVVMPDFMAVVNGSVWSGSKTPAGTKDNVLMASGYITQVGLLNKTAMDAVMAAKGFASF